MEAFCVDTDLPIKHLISSKKIEVADDRLLIAISDVWIEQCFK